METTKDTGAGREWASRAQEQRAERLTTAVAASLAARRQSEGLRGSRPRSTFEVLIVDAGHGVEGWLCGECGAK